MSAYVLWIDSKEAKLWELKPEGVQQRNVHLHGQKHPTHPHGHSDKGHHPEAQKLFHSVAESLKGATELLVLGPGEAKNQFKKHLDEHHHTDLAKKVVGIEAVDTHLTEPQVLAHARKFFKTHDLFV